MFPRPDFYGGALLNFAENLLFPANVEVKEFDVAIITATEDETTLTETTWAQLREQVRKCTNAMRAAGVQENTVVAGFVANHATALVAILSAAALGAVWTGISPDNGVSAVLDRLVQIRPQVLFADNATLYNGKRWSCTEKTVEIVDELKKHGLELVLVINGLNGIGLGLEDIQSKGVKAVDFDGWLQR
jgi:acetoacetyl-CoA synthetase